MLLESAKGERLWTTLSFAKPLPFQAVNNLLKETGVEPVSYTQVGWTTTGERMGSTIFAGDSSDFDLEKAAREAISQDPNAPDYKAQMAGFMVIEGYITISQESLGKLLRDERVYIVDTTAHEVTQLVKAGEATVHLSTPFWNMDWGTTQSSQKLFLPLIDN